VAKAAALGGIGNPQLWIQLLQTKPLRIKSVTPIWSSCSPSGFQSSPCTAWLMMAPGLRCTCGNRDCEHPAKHPFCLHGFKDAVHTVRDYRRLCLNHDNLNVGAATGEIVVINGDVRHGGDVAWWALVRELGIVEAVDSTVQALSGSGGPHVYFRRPAGIAVRSSSNQLARGVDIRAAGGYIICAPSRHIRGGTYSWEASHHPADTQIAPIPPALLERILAGANKQNGNGRSSGFKSKPRFEGGERNTMLHASGRSMHAKEWSDEAIRAALRAENLEKCQPPLGDDEVEQIIASVLTGAGRADFAGKPEDPQPLTRPLTPPAPYPERALGILADMVRAVHERTQAPISICANSTLAAVNYQVQAHADVVLPTGRTCPLSEFFLTIAESGERKSSADELATEPIAEYERQLQLAYDDEIKEWKTAHAAWCKQRDQALADKNNATREAKVEALRKLGSEPPAPLQPMLLCTEPTFEGLVRLMHEGHASVGLFSDEGGQFVGGHAMSEETRLKTAAGFSKLWGGNPVKRTRQGEGSYTLYGRRVALHLLVQPGVACKVFADEILKDQGLLTRVLAVFPEPAAGSRPWKEVDTNNFSRISSFSRGAAAILGTPQPLALNRRNELVPRKLPFGNAARELWIEFVNHCEREMRRGGEWESIRGLANKLPEHAARLAGTLELFGNLEAATLGGEALACGIELAQYYAAEALRIREASTVVSELDLAERLRRWLCEEWPHPLVAMPHIYQLGSRPIRSREAAQKLVAILEDHGWLVRTEPAEINGKFRRMVWKVMGREAE
jgi:hypothetical protein